MNRDLRLRDATPADVDTILDLIRALARYEREPDAVHATPDLIREHLFGPRPAAECILAELRTPAGHEAAGFALFFHNFSTWLGRPGLYLEDLFVRPEHRGRGIGKALLTHLARIAVARGCGRMEWAVLDWNEPAIGFYKRLGAQPMDEWTIFRLTGDRLRALADARTE